jgi:hypothetical protein
MKKDFAFALVLVAAGVAVTAACSSSSKDKDSKDGGAGAGAAGGVGGGGSGGASGSAGSGGGVGPDGGGASGRGGASGASGASGAAGTGGSSGDCAMDVEPCEVNGDCCGFSAGENVCVDTGDATLGSACLVVCTANSQCQSNCCATLQNSTTRVCGPAALCGGSNDGGTCADDLEPCETNGDCCGFAAGENFCVDTGTPPPQGLGVACLIACTTNSQCQSGCCAALEGGMGRVCGPVSLCQ